MVQGDRNERIFILNGANLNMLGVREPDIYGTTTLAQIEDICATATRSLGFEMDFRQTNHEGVLIDWLHEAHTGAAGVVLNPGGFTRTSIAILDAVKAIASPVIELHLSNFVRRDPVRPPASYISHGAAGVIFGFGAAGYRLALEGMRSILDQRVGAGGAAQG